MHTVGVTILHCKLPKGVKNDLPLLKEVLSKGGFREISLWPSIKSPDIVFFFKIDFSTLPAGRCLCFSHRLLVFYIIYI